VKKDPARFSASDLLGQRVPLVLLYGNDDGLMEVLEEEVRGELASHGASWLRVEEGDFLASPHTFLMPDLFSGGDAAARVVFIADPGDKNTPAYKTLIPMLDRVTLVLGSLKLRTTSALVQLVLKDALCWGVGCYPLELASKMTLAQGLAKRRGLTLADGVARAMASFCDVKEFHQLLQKFLFLTQATVTQPMFEACWGEGKDRDTELAYGLSGRDGKQVAHWFAAIPPSESIPDIRQAQRHFLQLLEVRAALDQNQPLDAAIQALKPPLFFKNAPQFKEHVLRWQTPDLVRAISMLVEAELQVKGGTFPHILTYILTRLTGGV